MKNFTKKKNKIDILSKNHKTTKAIGWREKTLRWQPEPLTKEKNQNGWQHNSE